MAKDLTEQIILLSFPEQTLVNSNWNVQNIKWGKTENNQCDYCKNIDTIEHHLFTCIASKNLWQSVLKWFKINLKITYNLTLCEVLFGIPIYNSADIQIINYVILLGKHYINKPKENKKQFTF